MANISSDPISTEKTIWQHVEHLMNAGSWVYNIQDHTLHWSDGIFQMLGYAPQSVTITPEFALSLVHPSDREKIDDIHKKAIQGRAEYSLTKRLKNKWGEYRTIQSRATLIKNELGIPVQLVGIFHDVTDIIEIQENLAEAKQTSQVLMENVDGIFWEADAETFQFTYVSPQCLEITGYAPEDWIDNPTFWADHIHPDDRDYAVNFCKTETRKNNNHVFDYRFRTRQGNYIWLHDRVKVYQSAGRPKRLTGLMVNVTAEYIYDALDKIEKKLLQKAIQRNCPLKELLDEYLQDLEQLFHGMRATVLRVSNGKLYSLSAPSFPQSYSEALNGFPIGINQGSCGTSAFLKKKVIVGNVYDDERWARFLDLPESYGFSACWSQPIFNYDNEVVATFALYYDSPKYPSSFEEFAIERSQRLLSLVITKFEFLENLQDSNERFQLINQATKDAIYDWEIREDKLIFGEGYGRLFGYYDQVNNPIPLSDWMQRVHPADLDKVTTSLQKFVEDPTKQRWECSYQYKRSDNSYAYVEEIGMIIRDQQGQALKMVGILRDNTHTRELQQLLDNASRVAKIGGWEMSLLDPDEKMFWSDMTREILEVDDTVTPSLQSILTLVKGDLSFTLADAIKTLIIKGVEFDLELPIKCKNDTEKWVRIIGNSDRLNNRCFKIYGSIQDIHQQKTNQLELSHKNRLLDALSIIISEFLQVDDWKQVLPAIFELTGQTAEVDRVYYMDICPDLKTGELLCCQQYEWVKNGVPPEINNPRLQSLPVTSTPEYFDPLLKGLPVPLITSQVESSNLRQLLEQQSIKSCLALPVMSGNQCIGLIGFDDCAEERKWTETEISFLKNVTSNLAAAIQRNNNRIQLEKALEERNTILESIGDGFCAVDPSGTITYWNKQAEEIFNLPRQVVEGRPAEEVFFEALQLSDEALYKELLHCREKKSIEYHAPGNNKWFDIVIYPSENGPSVFFRDISIRKNTEAQIRQSNERFEIVTQATNDAIWDYDLEKNEFFFGQGFSSLFGYNLEKLNPSMELLLSFIHPDDRAQIVEKVQSYLSGENLTNTWVDEYRFLKANGDYAFVLVKAIFIRNEHQEVIRALGALSDISQRKQFETSLKDLNLELEEKVRELAISNRELEQFAYVASHDLQEPLRMVTSFLTQLEKKYQPRLDEKARQYIYFATDGAKRMRQIILDLLDFSRIGKVNEKAAIVDLNDVVKEAITLNRNLIHETRGHISYGTLPVIESYYAPLLQVVQNLLANALKYRKPDQAPKIRILANELEDCWQISVSDNGIGIPAEYHERIFVIFQRLHKREEYSGTGIGLAIVKKIVENLGGKISVESEPDKGSTFHFTVPKTIISRN